MIFHNIVFHHLFNCWYYSFHKNMYKYIVFKRFPLKSFFVIFIKMRKVIKTYSHCFMACMIMLTLSSGPRDVARIIMSML